jgi:hypothetical protein
MDDSLRILQYVYEEEVDDPSFVRRVNEDDDLRREYERLRETKEVLDRRSTPSPDPAVVDRVVDHAADAAREQDAKGPMPDRAARAPERGWGRRLQTASAALVLLLVVGLGWWQLRPDATTPGGANPWLDDAHPFDGHVGPPATRQVLDRWLDKVLAGVRVQLGEVEHARPSVRIESVELDGHYPDIDVVIYFRDGRWPECRFGYRWSSRGAIAAAGCPDDPGVVIAVNFEEALVRLPDECESDAITWLNSDAR